jgi:hypothetical protein
MRKRRKKGRRKRRRKRRRKGRLLGRLRSWRVALRLGTSRLEVDRGLRKARRSR